MTLDEGIKRAEDRGDWCMVRWLQNYKDCIEQHDYTVPIPCWKYVQINTWQQQMAHVYEELGEVVQALHDSDVDHAAEELTDLITASTTMLEILGYGKERRLVLQAKVNEKNRKRGYWEGK